MVDDREREGRQFAREQDATRLHILTAVTPFRAAQDRFVLLERAGQAMLVACRGCPFRAPLSRGEPQPLAPARLEEFLAALAPLAVDKLEDYFPEGAHDGTTIVFERLDERGYVQVALLNPPKNSPHARLVSAWSRTFPAVRSLLRG
ncbi:MAG: hypothetical protein LC121_15515 [Anaerolineae bacterium]|nr:hypothetical protein [Anaerolineae bacterium]